MATQTQTDFMEIVRGRRSIRNYDTDVKISKEEMTQILEEATLAPSSVNMQPWRFLVIDSEEGKATLAPLAKFNQVQVETSSAVIAVFGDMNAVDQLENIYDTAVAKRAHATRSTRSPSTSDPRDVQQRISKRLERQHLD